MFKPGHYYVVFTAGRAPLGPFQTIPAAMKAHEAAPRAAMIVQAVMSLAEGRASGEAEAASQQNSGEQSDKASAPPAAKGKPQDKGAPARA